MGKPPAPPVPTSNPLDGRTPKYRVLKWDGTPLDPGAKYLTLRIDGKPKDSAEVHALQAYILACDMDGRGELADHLRRFFGFENDPLFRHDEAHGKSDLERALGVRCSARDDTRGFVCGAGPGEPCRDPIVPQPPGSWVHGGRLWQVLK